MNSFPMHNCPPPLKPTHYSGCHNTDDEDDNDVNDNRNDDDNDKKDDAMNRCKYQQQKNLDSEEYFH